ncbi:MAG: peptide-binding protein [Verrucomicrobiae bacterium]|nr:peptide-binding protein [Verrucomicrobiae bacterium]
MTHPLRGLRPHPIFPGLLAAVLVPLAAFTADFYVSPSGHDRAAGTLADPFPSPNHARLAARSIAGRQPVTVHLLAGTHYLADTLVLTAADSGTRDAPVVWQAAEGQTAVLSGGTPLNPRWEPFRDGILRTAVPKGIAMDQLFADGQRLPMARYPNFHADTRPFHGFDPDAIAPERVARWADPSGGFLHALHRHEWGGFHFRILGRNPDDTLRLEGGWQNNRRLGLHPRFRMVENIFEELDAPGEWFHDPAADLLYLRPPTRLDPHQTRFETARLAHLVELRGTPERPVRFITLRNLTFRHTARTFMETREPLLRSDWTIYRGGALLFEGTEDCAVEDAFFDTVGGNAVFVSRYNRRTVVRGCHIANAGANGVAFVGDPRAVCNPLFEYGERQRFADLDLTPGPLTPDYPADGLVEDCLIYRTGQIEKQTAPIQIAMARDITVRHCSLYDVPRAGINIGDGCWGGHVIEFCDVFNTVLETGDHGSFNSWGRDRYWELEDLDANTLAASPHPQLPFLDAVRPVILRNNRWRCDHGWDIDLDDGSSNYQIRDNLCLSGGIKLREGFGRLCENNVMVANSFHPHVWYRGSGDIFRRNIVFDTYKPIRVPTPWGDESDFNLLHTPGRNTPLPATNLQAQSGRDASSILADARFLDPERGDYRVHPDSPALTLGFRNFPMDRFGVRRPNLRAIASTPELPAARAAQFAAAPEAALRHVWMGATLKSLAGPEEASSVGVSVEVGGVIVLEVPPDSPAARAGFLPFDLIQSFRWKPVRTLEELATLLRQATGAAEVGVRRRQRGLSLHLDSPITPSVPLPQAQP